MTDQKPGSTRELLFIGLFAIAMGVITVLIAGGMIPAKPAKGEHAPMWLAVLSGSIFLLAGTAIMLRALAGGTAENGDLPADAPLWLRVLYYAMGLTIVGALAAIGTWVAFGPGERTFSTTIPFLASGPANEWIGRVAFGAGAIIGWLMFAVFAMSWWRKLKRATMIDVAPPGSQT
jgi:hypothetical protein